MAIIIHRRRILRGLAFWIGLTAMLINLSFVARAEDLVKGTMAAQSFCKRSLITVSTLILTCDSPGAYYQGSSSYRNAEICKAKDKANLIVWFSTSPSLDVDSVYVSVESGLYDNFITVLDMADLCQSGMVVGDNASLCPTGGNKFQFKTYFMVPYSPDLNFQYTPDIKITFYDQEGARLGCATTGTVALHKVADAKAARGRVALGISIFVFVGVFSTLIYLSHLRKQRIERLRESKQNYQYFRTLPSGQVIPLPGGPQPQKPKQPPPITQVTSEDASSTDAPITEISNPSYNTTHVPTRPII